MKISVRAVLSLILLPAVLSSCAYRFGSPERRIPGGYHLIAVPVFKNKTQEVAIESFFTQSMIMEVERSSLAQVTAKEESQAILLGEIVSVEYVMGTSVTNETKGYEDLPTNSALAKDYRIVINTHIKLVRSSDMAVLWQGTLTGEKSYPAPAITMPVINTANPLYNQSARSQNIHDLSQDMMAEGFERLTENF